MNWLKHLFGPRKRLAGAMALATTVALAGSLFAAPASASAQEDRGINVRTVNLEGGRGALEISTSDGGRILRSVAFRHGGRHINVFRGHVVGHRFGHLEGRRFGIGRLGFGYRWALPAATWGGFYPYLGMPFGYPYGYGLGPLSFSLGYPWGWGGGIRGALGLGDRDWLRFDGD